MTGDKGSGLARRRLSIVVELCWIVEPRGFGCEWCQIDPAWQQLQKDGNVVSAEKEEKLHVEPAVHLVEPVVDRPPEHAGERQERSGRHGHEAAEHPQGGRIVAALAAGEQAADERDSSMHRAVGRTSTRETPGADSRGSACVRPVPQCT